MLFFKNYFYFCWTSVVAHMVKNVPVMQETHVWSLGWQYPLEDNCCVGFCLTTSWISHNSVCVCVCVCVMNQNYVCIPSILSPHPIPPLQVITECQAGLPVLYISFPEAICFTHSSIYIRQYYFLNLSHVLCPQVHFLCLCFCSFPADGFISTIFLDSIYML